MVVLIFAQEEIAEILKSWGIELLTGWILVPAGKMDQVESSDYLYSLKNKCLTRSNLLPTLVMPAYKFNVIIGACLILK